MLHYWLYISTAKVPPRSANDALIYLQARDRNSAHAISGYLHRENGYYVQYIEGPEAALKQLKRLICHDWRHEKVRVLLEGRSQSRRFAGWDMAFTNEEMSSFRTYQASIHGETDISRASAQDILVFCKE